MKNFFFFAFISCLFLLGCPSDGYIDERGNVHWDSYPSSNSNSQPPQGDMYCYNYDGDRDCTPISTSCRFASESACTSVGGTVHTEVWCLSNAANGIYLGYCDYYDY